MKEAELFEELRQANEALRIAEAETGAARSREVAALNRVNKVQRAITDLAADLKKNSPRETDWRCTETRGLPA
jgi:hypothetical protein